MKKLLLAALVIVAVGCNNPQLTKQTATDLTFQIKMPRPVFFVERVIPEETEVDEDERIKGMIADAIADEKQRAEDAKLVYESFLTSIMVYGHEPKSRTQIPMGALSGMPTWAE